MNRQDSEFEVMRGLWYRDERKRRPDTTALFLAISGEALACLVKTNWDVHIKNIENLVTVIRWRMRRHWDEWHMSELEKLALKAKKEVDRNVE